MKFVNGIQKYLRNFDFLTHPPNLKVNSMDSYKTVIGGVLTLAIFCLVILSAIYFGAELVLRMEPQSIITAKQFDSIQFQIAPSEYFMFIGIENSEYKYYLDKSTISIRAYVLEINIDDTGNTQSKSIDVNIDQCSNFYNSSEASAISSFKIDTELFYCLDPNQTLEISNYWGANYSSALYIEVNKCLNSTTNNCSPIEEINEHIRGGIITIYSRNNLIDINSLENPIRVIYDDIFYALDPNFTFKLFLALRKMEFYSDSGFILNEKYHLESFYSEVPHIIYYGSREERLGDIVIQGKPQGRAINRNYVKFQDVLTNIGGFIECIVLLGNFISNTISRFVFFNDLIFNLRLKESQIKIGTVTNSFIGKAAPIINNFAMINKHNPDMSLGSSGIVYIQNNRPKEVKSSGSTKLPYDNFKSNQFKYVKSLTLVNTNCIYHSKDWIMRLY